MSRLVHCTTPGLHTQMGIFACRYHTSFRDCSLFTAGGRLKREGDIEFECKQFDGGEGQNFNAHSSRLLKGARFECEQFSESDHAVNNDHLL